MLTQASTSGSSNGTPKRQVCDPSRNPPPLISPSSSGDEREGKTERRSGWKPTERLSDEATEGRDSPCHLAVYLPAWAVDRLVRRDGTATRQWRGGRSRPLLLAETVRGQRLVAGCCARCTDRGVRVGMSIAHATALLPVMPRVMEHRPAADAAALRALARWAIRFAPQAMADQPDGLLLDATGCRRLYGTIRALVRKLRHALRDMGLEARIAAAPTIGAAWGLSRHATDRRRPEIVVDEAGLDAALAKLPVSGLRLDEAVVDQLNDVGIETVGQLRHVARDEIAQRFGAQVLLRLDQAGGEAMEVLEPQRPPRPVQVALRFGGPTTKYEAIEKAVRKLVDDLSAALLKREAGVRRMVLEVERLNEDLRTSWGEASVTLGCPSRTADHLWAMLRPHVERLDMGRGVEALRLRGRGIEVLPHGQERLGDDGEEERARSSEASAGRLIDLLQSRLGRDAVLRCRAVETHVPEAAFAFHPADEPSAVTASGCGPSATDCASGANAADAAGAAELPDASVADRPTVLLSRPQPVKVTLMQPEGPIVQLRWRRMHRIITCIGPERIARRWWYFAEGTKARRREGTKGEETEGEGGTKARRHGGAAVAAPGDLEPARDYYKLQDEQGRWLWVYRNLATGRWYVQGVWG